MGYELDAHFLLAFEHGGWQLVVYGLELGGAPTVGVVDAGKELVVDIDVELAAAPFVLSLEGELEEEGGLLACLHEVAEVVAVACIAVEDAFGAASL